MWKKIIEKFDKFPSQKKVIKKLLELGLKVGENNKIYCNDVEINISSLAKSINTDRRVVISTIENILDDKELKRIFTNIQPAGPVLSNISEELGLGVIEIEGNGQKAGILNNVTNILANENISIRQAYAGDPDLFNTPHMTIITDSTVDGKIIPLLLKIDGVTKVSMY
ncbi:MAG: amino acid-binding protein [Methanosphaera sp. rholeuAM6]|nr:MAG: amino acid-binding protein [Methanosphaera sp. rholeuAM6]